MLFNALLLALRAIRRNLLRSFLTVLGVVIGVASVITMVFLGDGTTAYVTNGIAKLGSNMLIISPGQQRRGPPTSSISSPPFKMADIEAIKHDIYGIEAVTPAASSNISAVFGNRNHATIVRGTDNDFFAVSDWSLDAGRRFTHAELNAGKTVCIIGHTIQEELFGEQPSLGKQLRLQSFSCQVIGVLEKKGSSMFGMDQDDTIIVPIRMFQRRISGNQDIPYIQVSAAEGVSTEQISDALTRLFRERRHIRSGELDDFNVKDLKEVIETVSETTGMLTLLLGAVAAISLLVGGIGIMNIMLVSVTERTREIGIRLAIGALEREVLLQFLVEAVVLSSLGGLIGISLGIGIAWVIASVFEIPFIFNQVIVLIAFAFSTIVGIVFGYFPARKAAHLNPIDALRHE